jgi:hypothetical protein
MATYLIHPLNLTFSSSQSGASTPASNLNVDYPNMVWRSTSATGAFLEFSLDSALPWDFIGLVGASLFAADTVRIRAASTQAGVTTAPAYDTTFSVSGTANSDFNLAFHAPVTVRTLSYFRLDFTLSGNPNAFVQAQRLVVGKRVEADGIDVGAEFNFEDTSRISDYRGIQISDPFDAKQSWKFSVSNVKVDDYNTNWRSFLKAASGKGVLFIPDTVNGQHSQESVFGRIQGQTNAGLMASDQYKVNLYIREA